MRNKDISGIKIAQHTGPLLLARMTGARPFGRLGR